MFKKFAALIFILLVCHFTAAQNTKNYDPARIFHKLQKLNFLGTVMYVAAHPDDENTRLISYMSNEVKARTVYLSITRGDGGQNLIGTELRELLGVLRTQELLAARRIDGGEQLFSRANDFGYSKNPEETLRIWNKEAVLGDVVRAIRKIKPDVIINRFKHDTPGSTHGHHTSSAILSLEAFDLAADPSAYPAQLQNLEPWQPKRLFFNTHWWFYGSKENFEKVDKSRMLKFDIGVYYPLMGRSNNEIAALSSSQHKCQGFGRLSSRGTQDEYLEFLKGDFPKEKKGVFGDLNTRWSRVEGGAAIGEILETVEANFNFKEPAVHLSDYLRAYKLVEKLKDPYWCEYKKKQLQEIIEASIGLWLEATVNKPEAVPGSEVEIQLEVLNRSRHNVKLQEVSFEGQTPSVFNIALNNNQPFKETIKKQIPINKDFTTPYWLKKPGSEGMYAVENETLIGLPETPPAVNLGFKLLFDDVIIEIERPVIYKYAEPSVGEIIEPFDIVPAVSVEMLDPVIIFNDNTSKQVGVKLRSAGKNSGVLKLEIPSNWKASPPDISFSFDKDNQEKIFYFSLTPPTGEETIFIEPVAQVKGRTYKNRVTKINYEHIPRQNVLLSARAKAVRINLQKTGNYIGYIMGAGDEVPASLKQMGYEVALLKPEELKPELLSQFDAIVTGIRAYNVLDELKQKQEVLLEYVKQGGNLIVQYNTAGRRGLNVPNLAPYELQISRDRVSEEDAEVTVLNKNHEVLSFPNTLGADDFKGWIQERGLYFPNKWGEEFAAPLSMADKGEKAKKGSLLVAPYGQGNYVYTGLSFFRELPAGVGGAYKLFANMLSLGKRKTEKKKIKG